MKPLPAQILKNGSETFKLVERRQPNFDSPFHFHNECEIVYIVKGHGKRVVGDNIDEFYERELVFLGSNLPHIWANANTDKNFCHSIVMYLNKELLYKYITGFEDMHLFKQLLIRAERGLIAKNNIPSYLHNTILSMRYADNFRRIIGVLEIIYFFLKEENSQPLTIASFVNDFQCKKNNKITEVIRFCNTRFKDDITLEQLANICCLTPQSFCRYFKAHTKTTFLDFLNDVRIANAKRFLIENESIIVSEVAYESGFRNLSNFNKVFKIKTGLTPKEYRKNFIEVIY